MSGDRESNARGLTNGIDWKSREYSPAPGVIRRVKRRLDEDGVASPAAASVLGIGNRRVSTMVDVSPETLALFDASPFGYAAALGPIGTESAAAFTDGPGLVESLPEFAPVVEAAAEHEGQETAAQTGQTEAHSSICWP